MKYNFSDQSSRKAAVILIVAYEKKNKLVQIQIRYVSLRMLLRDSLNLPRPSHTENDEEATGPLPLLHQKTRRFSLPPPPTGLNVKTKPVKLSDSE